MTTYFTSDIHFGHANIIKYCNRPYSSVEDMNRDLIAKFNARVGADDTVYILGDFALGPKTAHYGYLQQLRGHKILILGNHDQSASKMLALGFNEVYSSLCIRAGGWDVYLRHIPDVDWNAANADYHLCGHVHEAWTRARVDYSDVSSTDLSNDNAQVLPDENGHIVNVGVDVSGFQPMTFDELLARPFITGKAHR